MRWLVTGVSGFLGGAVGEAAAAAGNEVVGIGRGIRRPSSWPYEYRALDFSCADMLVSLIREIAPDYVAHFAGSASVSASFEDPASDFQDSTVLWFRLLDAIRISGLHPRIAFASSAAVYGSPKELPITETAPRHPESPYGFHKMLSEQVAEEFARCFGLAIVALRFFSVFGPRQRRLLIWELFEQLRQGTPILRLKGTGDERRDFLFVDEAAHAVVSLMKTEELCLGGFRAFNIASGCSISVREVAEALRAFTGSRAKIVFGCEELKGNPSHWEADLEKFRQLLPAWNPTPFSKSLAICARAWNSEISKTVLSSANM